MGIRVVVRLWCVGDRCWGLGLLSRCLFELIAETCAPRLCLQVIPLDPSGRVSEAFNVRLEELGVRDLVLLAGGPQKAAVTQRARSLHTVSH
jgi:hypothetical protein